jgi:hypothetical protein
MVAFEACFGMKPTALMMCPSDAEIWIAAQKRGQFLLGELKISVNPLNARELVSSMCFRPQTRHVGVDATNRRRTWEALSVKSLFR